MGFAITPPKTTRKTNICRKDAAHLARTRPANGSRHIPPTKNALVHYRPKRNGITILLSPNRIFITLVASWNLDWEKLWNRGRMDSHLVPPMLITTRLRLATCPKLVKSLAISTHSPSQTAHTSRGINVLPHGPYDIEGPGINHSNIN